MEKSYIHSYKIWRDLLLPPAITKVWLQQLQPTKCSHYAVATYSYKTQLLVFTKVYHNLIAVFQEHATNHIQEAHMQLDTIT